MSFITVADNGKQKVVCETNDLDYTPDLVRHRYGESERPPLEDWFLDELRFIESEHPSYEIFTLGSSLVFGEKFITYLTACEFELADKKDFPTLVEALRKSDLAIRRKVGAMWKWDCAASSEEAIVMYVGWLDFAYFLQHRRDFLDPRHGHFMGSFVERQDDLKARDYKILRDGSIVPFDEAKLSEDDARVFENYERIEYTRTDAS